MININELRAAVKSIGIMAVSTQEVLELLDRLEEAEASAAWYERRCSALQEQQSKMRDPERTIVCDILANGAVLPPDYAGDRYAIKDT